MALFGGSRDISLIQTLNKELINDIIQTEIGYYMGNLILNLFMNL